MVRDDNTDNNDGATVPVDLHQRLSEFSYGYGVTREAERLLQFVGLRTTPFLPSLLQEKKLAFDVAFDRPGAPLLLQFKLGEAVQRLRWQDPSNPPPVLSRPSWRFNVDTAEPDGQFDLLLKAEQAGAEVYYVAPRFTTWNGYVLAYESDKVLDRSLLLSPSQIDAQLRAVGAPDGRHRVLYDERTSFVCSEAKELTEVRARDLAHKIRTDIEQRSRRMDLVLRDVHLALEREREIRVRPPTAEPHGDTPFVMQSPTSGELASAPEHLLADRSRRFSEFQERAVSEPHARFAALGFEAWATPGSQLVAVTLPKEAD
jgi:hypothetical protein